MLADKNPYIESAYQKLQIISQDKDKRLEYEAREKANRDYNEGLLEAEEHGMERLNKLTNVLLQNKCYDDLERSANDTNFQQQLMREYNIIKLSDMLTKQKPPLRQQDLHEATFGYIRPLLTTISLKMIDTRKILCYYTSIARYCI